MNNDFAFKIVLRRHIDLYNRLFLRHQFTCVMFTAEQAKILPKTNST